MVFNFYFILNLKMNNQCFKIIGDQLNLPDKVVEKTYKAYWQFIKTTIEALPLNTELSEKEYDILKTSFNIPSLGKLNCTYKRKLKK